MGIEDLNLNLTELADKVLVVSENQEHATAIGALLTKRSYAWTATRTPLEASKIDELFDLIILVLANDEPLLEKRINSLRAFPRLRRAPLIVVSASYNERTEEIAKLTKNELLFLPLPYDPTNLLVKVATQLRMRKIQTEQATIDAQLTAQNAQLRDLTNRYKHELSEARSIQQAIMPKKLPKHENCIFAAKYLPLEAVGGDLFDLWEIDSSMYGLFIGDVTGHGLPAAFIGAMTKMALAYADKNTPSEMLEQMNNGISEHMPAGRFVTVAAAFYEPKTGRLMIARGGHPPPVIFRAKTQSVEFFEPKGLPLGIASGVKYPMAETTLEVGDKFLLYTDGLPESANLAGTMLGIEGLGECFRQSAIQLGIKECFDDLLAKRDEFCQGRLSKDDDTFVGIERLS